MGFWYSTPDGGKFVEKGAAVDNTYYLEPTFKAKKRRKWLSEYLKSKAHEDFIR